LSSHNASDIMHNNGPRTPFGKRLYDEVVVKKIESVAKLKFWSAFLPSVVLSILLEVSPSNRVARFTAKPISFDDGTVKNVFLQGDKIIIPPLIVHFTEEFGAGVSNLRIGPIKVLSFVSDKKIPPGAETKAVLLTGATNGLIKARLAEPLKVDGSTVLDAGVLLMGQGHSTDERLYVQFSKAVFSDGKFIQISAQGYDISDSIVGLKGSRVGDIGLKLAASSGLYFLSGMATGLQTPPFDDTGRPRRPTTQDAALNGVAQATSESAKGYMQDIKNRPPLIEVKAGTVFLVTFDGGDQ
jgi:Bacterial conjugation TrbI-like protein